MKKTSAILCVICGLIGFSAHAQRVTVVTDTNGALLTPSGGKFAAANGLLTNYAFGLTLNGTFFGDGCGLANLQSTNLNGVIPTTGLATNATLSSVWSFLVGKNGSSAWARKLTWDETNLFFTDDTIRLGAQAGAPTLVGSYSTFIQKQAGQFAVNATAANFFGFEAGQYALGAANANFFGPYAGQFATNANNAHFIGQSAGQCATNGYCSVFLGSYAGQYATNANNSVFVGFSAGQSASNSYSSVFIGAKAGQNLSRPNTLVIEANGSYAPGGTNALVYGEFDNRKVVVNGTLTHNGNVTFTNSYARFVPAGNVDPAVDPSAGYLYGKTNAGSVKLYTMNSAGTVTLISPHEMDTVPQWMIDSWDPFPNVTCEQNVYLGQIRWHNHSRQAYIGQFIASGMSLTNWPEPQRTFIWVEDFDSFNRRMSYKPGDAGYLAMHSWAADQQSIQDQYAADFAAEQEDFVLGQCDAPPVWNPPVWQDPPQWMQDRGVLAR